MAPNRRALVPHAVLMFGHISAVIFTLPGCLDNLPLSPEVTRTIESHIIQRWEVDYHENSKPEIKGRTSDLRLQSYIVFVLVASVYLL